MATTIYTYRMHWGDTLRISTDLAQASAPIYYEGADEDDWQATPFQTADAKHRERDMLRLVVGYLGASWYADPSSSASRESQLNAACRKAVLLRP